MTKIDVLIIDDEVRRMQATVELLQADNYAVEQIGSPSAAFQRLQQNPAYARVIILDIMMPPDGDFNIEDAQYGLRTGILFLAKLKSLPDFKTPVIVLTASDEFKDEVKTQVHHYLKKPVPYGTLREIIDHLMPQKAGGRPS